MQKERERNQNLEEREKELRDRLSAQMKDGKLGVMEAQAKLKQLAQENERLQDMVNQQKNQIEVIKS